MNQIATIEPTSVGVFSSATAFENAQRMANALSKSTLVPKEYQGNLPNALIALEVAQRIGASPLLVMQNLYVVHGRPAWSSQFLIASCNQCGRFTAMQYEFKGQAGSDDWSCRAWAKEKQSGETVYGPWVSIGMAKAEGWHGKSGSKWKTMPELMLTYRAAAFFVRTKAPEISMGMHTADEVRDMGQAERVYEAVSAAPVADLDAELIAPAAQPAQETEKPDTSALRDGLLNTISQAESLDELEQIGKDIREDYAKTLDKDDLEEIRAAFASRKSEMEATA